MAKPRVFVSSTFYDLKQLRADLERFIRSMGYDPVLNETGKIPYGKDLALEEYCYREITTVDIVVALVGGRFGAQSQHHPYSVSQQEIRTALENDKPVFIFVQSDVLAEFSTYKKNKGNTAVDYAAVTDSRVYTFIEELYALPQNNPIAPFDHSEDVTNYLKEQWAGLFQRWLSEQTRKKEVELINRLSASTETLNQLVQLLAEEKRGSDIAVREILLTTHPIFEQLRRLTNTRYRIFFANRGEMGEWLNARSYKRVKPTHWDDPEVEEWIYSVSRQAVKGTMILRVAGEVFDIRENLKIYTPSEWKSEWLTVEEHRETEAGTGVSDDDIPF